MTPNDAATIAHLCFMLAISLGLSLISSRLLSIANATRRIAYAEETRNELFKEETELYRKGMDLYCNLHGRD